MTVGQEGAHLEMGPREEAAGIFQAKHEAGGERAGAGGEAVPDVLPPFLPAGKCHL